MSLFFYGTHDSNRKEEETIIEEKKPMESFSCTSEMLFFSFVYWYVYSGSWNVCCRFQFWQCYMSKGFKKQNKKQVHKSLDIALALCS